MVTCVWGKAQANSADSTDSTGVKGSRHMSRRGSDRQTNVRIKGWEHPQKAAQRQMNSPSTQLSQNNVARDSNKCRHHTMTKGLSHKVSGRGCKAANICPDTNVGKRQKAKGKRRAFTVVPVRVPVLSKQTTSTSAMVLILVCTNSSMWLRCKCTVQYANAATTTVGTAVGTAASKTPITLFTVARTESGCLTALATYSMKKQI